MSRSTVRQALLFAAAAALLPAPAAGQRVRGQVVDAEGGPLADVLVLLSTGTREPVGALSDSAGNFVVVLPAAGTWQVSATRLGYQSPPPALLDFAPGEEVALAIRMSVDAVSLAPVQVVGRRRVASRVEEVYARIQNMRDRGVGRGLTRLELERLSPQSVGAAVGTLSGRVRAVESVSPIVNTLLIRDGTRPGGHCAPAVYVDGFRVNHRPANVNLMIDPRHVEAVELYIGGAQVPVGFHDPRGCGSVLIWSKQGSTEGGKPNSWKRYGIAALVGVGLLLLVR